MHLSEGNDWQRRLVFLSPGERCAAQFCRIAATREGVAHRPAELKHGLAVEINAAEATAPY
jgi:hypothetical protein